MTRLTTAFAAFAALALTGCSDVDNAISKSSVRDDVRMTPAEVRIDMAARENSLTATLGGMWDNQDNYMADACGDNDEGYFYDGGRNRSDPIADRPGASQKIAVWLKDNGYTVSHSEYGEKYVVEGVASNGTSVILNLAANRTWVDIKGPCLRGDWKKISDDDVAAQRNDIVRTPTPAPPQPTEP